MKTHKFNISIITLFLFLFTVAPAHAQFGGLIKKAKEKGKQANAQNESSTPQLTAPVNSNPASLISNNASSTSSPNVTKNSSGNTQSATGAPKPGEPGFIGLSKKPVDPKNLSATQFTNAFANGDYIYGIVFFEKPLSEYLTISNYNTNAKDMVMGGFETVSEYGVPQPGEPKDFSTHTMLAVRIYVTPEMMNQTFATFAVFPDPKSNFSFSEGITGYTNVKDFLENAYTQAKRYELALTFTDSRNQPVARLENISIDFSNKATYLVWKSAYSKSLGQEMGKQAGNNEMPQAAQNNPALARQFAALLQPELGATKLLKVIIISPSWQITHNELTGRIVNRYIATRNIVREEEGGYCRTRYTLFVQDYNGAGFGRTYAAGTTGATDDYVIDCAKVK